jgi:hypothetical protein
MESGNSLLSSGCCVKLINFSPGFRRTVEPGAYGRTCVNGLFAKNQGKLKGEEG